MSILTSAEFNPCARLSFLNKVACLRLRALIQKETGTGVFQVFSCEFCEIFKNTFFTEHFSTPPVAVSDYYCHHCGSFVFIVLTIIWKRHWIWNLILWHHMILWDWLESFYAMYMCTSAYFPSFSKLLTYFWNSVVFWFKRKSPEYLMLPQSAFTFSKLIVETLEQSVKYVQS